MNLADIRMPLFKLGPMVISLAAVLTLSGCSGGNEAPESTEEATAPAESTEETTAPERTTEATTEATTAAAEPEPSPDEPAAVVVPEPAPQPVPEPIPPVPVAPIPEPVPAVPSAPVVPEPVPQAPPPSGITPEQAENRRILAEREATYDGTGPSPWVQGQIDEARKRGAIP